MRFSSFFRIAILPLFFFGIFCVGTPNASAEGPMQNMRVQSVTGEKSVVSFEYNRRRAGSTTIIGLDIRIDGSYRQDLSRPKAMYPYNLPGQTVWFPWAHFPDTWSPVDVEFGSLSEGTHTMMMVFWYSLTGFDLTQVVYQNIQFTTIDPSKSLDGTCSRLHYYCGYGTPNGSSARTFAGFNTYTWNCAGSNGGSDVFCSESTLILLPPGLENGACVGTHYQCMTNGGSPANFAFDSSTNMYSWSCIGKNGGTTAACSEVGTPVSGTLSVDFTADPTTINEGESSKLRWTSTGATACHGINFSAQNATENGIGVTVSPTVTTDYTLSCVGGGKSVTQSVRVTVIPKPLSVDLKITVGSSVLLSIPSDGPLTVSTGSTHVLTWYSDFAYGKDSCIASSTDNSWGGSMLTVNNGLMSSTRQKVTPIGLVAYTITCSNGSVSASDTVVVNVDSPVPTFSLSATKTGSGVGAFSVTDGTISISNSPLNCVGNLPCTGVESGIVFGLKRAITAHLGTNVAVSWSGDCDSISTDVSGDVVCTTTLTSDKSVTAQFDGPPVPNVLSLCTDTGITPIATGTMMVSRNLFPNMSERFKAFYDTDSTDCAGTEVTGNWIEPVVSPIVSISGNNATPQVITAGSIPGTETVTLTQGADTISLDYTIHAPPCTADCSDASNICSGTVFDARNCGSNNCTGARNCDYNFREVSP